MATSEAEQPWQEAKKVLTVMHKKIHQIEKSSASGNELSGLEALEHLLERLRLASMATAFTDMKFAHKHGVEDNLWQTHTAINNEYRKALSRLRGSGHIVQLRNVEKQYVKHLKTAQYFYKGFIERLSARYRLPHLQRVAQRMQSESVKVNDIIDAQAASVDAEVTLSCYRTLLHLGDLARYRMKQARQKGRSPDAALTYYSLAQDIVPTIGDAHHQIGVVLADEKKDFDIVYHFYRAWAVQQPHPNASKNLESEFKLVLAAASSQRRGTTAVGPQQTFALWFVRLHAHYFSGEPWSSQDELEQEALHHFDTLLTTPGSFSFLLKAVHVNICAYDVALRKVQKQWTMTGSQSCQFILRFNTRTILAIARVLEKEIQAVFDRSNSTDPATNSVGGSSDNNRPSNTRESLDTSLQLIRIYMAWICASHQDLVDFKQYLDPYVSDMHRVLTKCLSKFMEGLVGGKVTSAPYLLPEDTETVGLTALHDCRAFRTVSGGPLKPRYDEPGIQRGSLQLEQFSRIYDIVDCGVTLVKADGFPWIHANVQQGSRQVPTIFYTEDSANIQLPGPPPINFRTTSVAAAGPECGDLRDQFDRLSTQPRDALSQKHSYDTSVGAVGGHGDYDVAIQSGFREPRNSELQVDTLDSDLQVDMETYNRVENFLSPPEIRAHPVHETDETSYGMHTSTAEEIFGDIHQRSPTIGSSASKTFPSLPWDFVYTPTPYRPTHGDPTDGGRSAAIHAATTGQMRSTEVLDDDRLEDPFTAAESPSRSFPPVPDSPWALTGASGNGRDQRLGQSVNMSRNLSSGHRYSGASQDAAGVFQLSPDLSRQAQDRPNSSHLGAGMTSPWRRQAEVDDGAYGRGNGAFYSTNFSQPSTSSLPQVQSPRGLPRAQHILVTQQGDEYDSYSQKSPQDGPDRISPAGQQNIGNNWAKAATAWGRGDLANKDDPTHFRNAIKPSHLMDDSLAYDRNALLSAFKGEQRPR